MTTYPPYTPMSSLGHELGILFGFFVACLFIMAVYTVIWQFIQRRSLAKDFARRRELQNRRPQRGRGVAIHEKMLDRYASPANRVELPVPSGSGAADPGAKLAQSAGLGVAFERTGSPLAADSKVGRAKGGNMREVL
ncbi:hypothetical protein PHISP_07380 [Aspergillus sp. HF37]|nr:hypothetical protein PHISP_07380 [Aspergillus sp. HF37]